METKYQGEVGDGRKTHLCDPSGRHWNEVSVCIESIKDGMNDSLASKNDTTALLDRLWNVKPPAHRKFVGANGYSKGYGEN